MRRTIWRMATLAVAAAAVGTGVLYAHERHPAGSSGSAWLGTLPRTANESSSTLPEGPVVLNNATTNAVGHVAGKKASGGAAPSTASTERGGSKDVSSASAHSTASPSGAATTAPKPAASGSGASGGTTTHAAKGAASGASAGQTGGGGGKTGLTAPAPNLGSFTIIVSENHGQHLISEIHPRIVAGESLMQYMHQNYQIETAYNDDFMVSINGIHSQWTGVPANERKPVDWFLYVNHQQAPVGAADIYPHAGDVDVWDYHSWDPSTGSG